MWRRHSCLRVKAAFQPPVLLEHGTGKSREPAGWKTCATNAALPAHRDQGFKRVSAAATAWFLSLYRGRFFLLRGGGKCGRLADGNRNQRSARVRSDSIFSVHAQSIGAAE